MRLADSKVIISYSLVKTSKMVKVLAEIKTEMIGEQAMCMQEPLNESERYAVT